MVVMFFALVGMLFWGVFDYLPKLFERFGSEGPRKVVGHIQGEAVRAGDLFQFYEDARAAGQISQWLGGLAQQAATKPEEQQAVARLTIGMTAWPILESTLKGEKVDQQTALTWMAMYREAQAAGFSTSPAQVEARLQTLQDVGLKAEDLKQVINRVAGGNRARLIEILRPDMTLRSYINWLSEVLSAAVDPELRTDFAQMDERIKVRLAVLKAADLVGEVKAATDAELQAQFDKGKAFLAGQGPDGCGYRIPDKAALEYLEADPAAFEAAVAAKITDADIKKYYEENKDAEFLAPPEEPKPGDKKPDEAAPPEKKYQPLAKVSDDIRKKLVRQEASLQARELLNANVTEIRGHKTPPDLRIWADGKKIRFVSDPALRSKEELAALKGLGDATHGNDRLPDVALAVAPLMKDAAKARLALMETSDVFAVPDGGAYAFRVAAVKANHEPAALKDVREKVLADVRLAKAFDLARERGKKLLEAAEAKGLEAAAKDAGVKAPESDYVPRERMFPYGGQFITIPTTLPGVGANRQVVSECFRLAAEGKKLSLVTLAEPREVVVAELVDRKAPREAAYDMMRPALAERIGQQVARQALTGALDLGAVQRRMQVVAQEPEAGIGSRRTSSDETDQQ